MPDMKCMPFVMLLLSSFAALAKADPAFLKDLNELRSERDKSIESALTEIDRKYAESLRHLLRRSTVNNDLETALEVQKELEKLNVPVNPDSVKNFEKEITGTKWSFPWEGRISYIQLKPKGELILGWHTRAKGYTWKVISPGVIEVSPRMNKAVTDTIRVATDRKSAKLIRDGREIDIVQYK